MFFTLLLAGLLETKLYQWTSPPAAGVFGSPAWSLIALIFCVGVAGICLLWWAPARRLALATPFVLILGAGTGIATYRSLDNLGPQPCYQLNDVNLGTLPSFQTISGGEDGPEWINVLTEGVSSVVPAEREAITTAVDASTDKLAQLLASLPKKLKPAVTRLAALAGSRTASNGERHSSTVQTDIEELNRYAGLTCGDAG